MTTARVPGLPLGEAKAAADEAAVPNYMAELSIFQVLLNHPQTGARRQRPARHHAVARCPRLTVARIGDHAHRLAHRMRLRVDPALARRLGTGRHGRRSARCARLAGTRRVRSHRAGGAGGHRRRGARRRGKRRELGGLRTRIARRHNGSHRTRHRDRCVANGRIDSAAASRSRWKTACPAGRRTAGRPSSQTIR